MASINIPIASFNFSQSLYVNNDGVPTSTVIKPYPNPDQLITFSQTTQRTAAEKSASMWAIVFDKVEG
jgi:hypothetical protein